MTLHSYVVFWCQPHKCRGRISLIFLFLFTSYIQRATFWLGLHWIPRYKPHPLIT